jgi:GDP-L-fucose synthase
MVGRSVAKLATEQGRDLLTADRSSLDITNQSEVEKFLKVKKPSSIIMAAAKVGGIFANMTNRKLFLNDNLQIQSSIINAANNVGINKLIFLGSSCIYPKFAPQPMSEDILLSGILEKTNEAYALAKIIGVKLCEYIRDENNVNYFSIMPTNLYGPGDNFDLKNSHVPAALMRKFHEAKKDKKPAVTIWGTGSPLREFMHVDDLASAILFLHDSPPKDGLINVGSGKEISIKNFALLIKNVVGYEGDLLFDSNMPDGSPRKLLDSSKIFGMGWSPKINLEEGINSTYNWFTFNLELGNVRGYAK